MDKYWKKRWRKPLILSFGYLWNYQIYNFYTSSFFHESRNRFPFPNFQMFMTENWCNTLDSATEVITIEDQLVSIGGKWVSRNSSFSFSSTNIGTCTNENTVKPAHLITFIQSNLPMWSPLYSQTFPCDHLY